MSLGATLLWATAVGGSLVVGSVAGAFLPPWERVASTLAVFGGGVLLAALAFDLVPKAEKEAGAALTAAGLLAGAALFLVADWALTREEPHEDLRRAVHSASAGRRREGSGSEEASRGKSLALGITIDGIPETAALGLTVAEGEIGIALLAGILASNLAESYGAAEPIRSGGYSRGFAVGLFAVIAVVLFAALVAGSLLLSGVDPALIGFAEAIAGGAIFATVNVALVPHAFAEVSRWAAVAAILGLVAGYLLS